MSEDLPTPVGPTITYLNSSACCALIRCCCSLRVIAEFPPQFSPRERDVTCQFDSILSARTNSDHKGQYITRTMDFSTYYRVLTVNPQTTLLYERPAVVNIDGWFMREAQYVGTVDYSGKSGEAGRK